MKKKFIFIIITLVIFIIAFTGCSATTSAILRYNCRWDNDEVLKYSVKSNNDGILTKEFLPKGEGTYETTLTTTTDGNHILKTEFSFTGTLISKDGESEVFTDTIKTQCKFNSSDVVGKRYLPTYAFREACVNVATLNEDGNVELTSLDFTLETKYDLDKDTAESTLKSEDEQALKDYFESVYLTYKTDYQFSIGQTNFFDNEQLLIAIRTFADDFAGGSINVLSVFDNRVKNITVSKISPSDDLKDDNGKSLITADDGNEYSCNVYQLNFSGNQSGSPITLYYEQDYTFEAMGQELTRSVLIKMTQGNLSYTLSTMHSSYTN